MPKRGNLNNQGLWEDVKGVVHTLTGGILNEPVYSGSGVNTRQRAKRARKRAAIAGANKLLKGFRGPFTLAQVRRMEAAKQPAKRTNKARVARPLPKMIYAQRVPAVSSGAETVTVRHKEFLCEVVSSSVNKAFSTNTFALNPGVLGPWISNLACAYSEYRWNSVIFTFQTSATNYSTDTTLGTTLMATQYDTNAPIFPDFQTMMEATGIQSARIDQNMVASVECSRRLGNKVHKVRTGPVFDTNGEKIVDYTDYDLGLFSIATTGCPASKSVGQLWVSYNVTLMKPVSSYGVTETSAHYELVGFDKDHFIGTDQTCKFDSLGVAFDDVNTIAFPRGARGNYKITLDVTGTTATLGQIATTLVNATALNLYRTATQAYQQIPVAGTNSTDVHYEVCIHITDPSLMTTVAFTGNRVVPTSFTHADLYIEEVNVNLKN